MLKRKRRAIHPLPTCCSPPQPEAIPSALHPPPPPSSSSSSSSVISLPFFHCALLPGSGGQGGVPVSRGAGRSLDLHDRLFRLHWERMMLMGWYGCHKRGRDVFKTSERLMDSSWSLVSWFEICQTSFLKNTIKTNLYTTSIYNFNLTVFKRLPIWKNNCYTVVLKVRKRGWVSVKSVHLKSS